MLSKQLARISVCHREANSHQFYNLLQQELRLGYSQFY